ncbi:gamma-aminobutyric acid type B receptor subunit 2-like [Dreissena polymorpha]|uniref:gamma-aminobutyric acid type B receptor subunit 2-like n=1 Tax=Dreissena polymorpha TaxID=45954 RepID=UPI0022649D6F|nr:gamma-aminobutyric acid type B receptor subunit 2-like [Dreissena polymorpha]
MENQSIIGMSGRISFAKGGADPDKNILLQRIQGGKRINIGYYRQDTDPKGFEWIPGALQWKDNKVPRDSTFVTRKEIVIPPSLYITLSVLSSLGILIAILFLSFNICYRTNRFVKLSSPNINNVLLLGCVLCYVTVFIRPTENITIATCQARVVCFCLGFTITFGALFTKTWRVYRIFTNKKLLKRTIKDIQLLAIIAVLVLLLTAILIVWQIFSPFEVKPYELENQKDVVGNDEEVRFFVHTCISKQSTYFEWTIFIIEGMMLTFGAFLAWETRHVTIAALNDSHQISLCLYNVVILSAVGLTLSLVLENQVVLLYGITSGFLVFGTTLTQLFVFIPKVHAVFAKVDCTINGVTGTAKADQGRSGGNASTSASSKRAPEN